MRIVTWNIRGGAGMDGRRSMARIADLLCAVDADVVCLQEAHRRTPWTCFEDQPARLADLLGMRPIFQNNLRVATGQYGNLVLTRLPVVSRTGWVLPNRGERSSRPALQMERRGLLEVVVAVPEGLLAVLTTHWSLDAGDRLASAERAAARVHEAGGRVVLTGDLNAGPVSEEVTAFGELSGLVDAVPGGPPTFPADAPRTRIDYVWLSRDLRCTHARVLETLASDHRPVVVEW
jgi:endonuclease/exonuclease/phosphatase family metal-dependent hydrolase